MLSVVGTDHIDGTMITATVDEKVVTYTHQTMDLQPRDYSAKSLGDLRFKAWVGFFSFFDLFCFMFFVIKFLF